MASPVYFFIKCPEVLLGLVVEMVLNIVDSVGLRVEIGRFRVEKCLGIHGRRLLNSTLSPRA